MSHRIRAFSTAEIGNSGASAPDSIEWMPAGGHVINCSLDGKPAEVRIFVEESLAAKLNSELQAARALAEQGKASRPFIDFDHASGEAAAIPVEFFWQDGVRLRVEWTAAGAQAIAGRVYSYFSPEFFADKSGNVTGIPSVGPIGALVNTPAFQAIERIAAAKALPNMNNIAKALGLPETATEAEILAKIAELSGAASETATECANAKAALELAQASLAEQTAKLKAAQLKAATDEVDRHAIAAGIPVEARPLLVAAILADEVEGRKVLAAFKPAAKPAPGAAPIKATATDNQPKSDAEILAAFNAMPEGKDKDNFQRANGSALLRASRAK